MTTLTFTFRDALSTALALVLMAGAWQVRGCQADRETAYLRASLDDARAALVDTVREDTVLPPDAGDLGALPDMVVVYAEADSADLEPLCAPEQSMFKPKDFDIGGIVTDRPVTIDRPRFLGIATGPPRVTLTTFDPIALRYEQDVFRIEPPAWDLSPYVGPALRHDTPAIDAGLSFRWNRLRLDAGATATPDGIGPDVSIRLLPFTINR